MSSTFQFARDGGAASSRNANTMSKSLIVTSLKDIGGRTPALNSTKNQFNHIEISDIINSAHRHTSRVKSPIVPKLDKSIAWSQSKDKKKRDFINQVINDNMAKVGPNHYTLNDPLMIETMIKPKYVKFPFYKTARESVIVE